MGCGTSSIREGEAGGEIVEPLVKIAAIQARPVSATMDDLWSGEDLPHALGLLAEAARGGATLICFPELYPRVGEEELRRAPMGCTWWRAWPRARRRNGTTRRS